MDLKICINFNRLLMTILKKIIVTFKLKSNQSKKKFLLKLIRNQLIKKAAHKNIFYKESEKK
jgi:hypothetical protein